MLTSHILQFRLIFRSIPPYQRKALLKCLIASVLLAAFIILFIWCNQIPAYYIDAKAKIVGPSHTRITIASGLGEGTQIGAFTDSTLWSPFLVSSRSGLNFSLTSSDDALPQHVRQYMTDRHADVLKNLQEEFAEYGQIDSLNTFVSVDWNCLVPVRRLSYSPKQESESLYKDPKVDFFYEKKHFATEPKKNRVNGWFMAKGPFEEQPFTLLPKFVSSPILYNRSLWALYDISQAYVALKVEGKLVSFGNDGAPVERIWQWDDTFLKENPVKLIVDFGSPIAVSGMKPQPDEIDMTSIAFHDPEKIKSIIDSGVIFHVRFLHNMNFQSMKLFLHTTIIAGIATWIISILWKWIVHNYRIRRGRKRRLANSNKNS